jgi:CDP-diacylglycerol---serine O-phosphatidyltransferase
MNEEQKTFNILKVIPNMITLTALCLSISSLRFALINQFDKAIMFIVIACFLDGIDGRVAKMLHASSDFGAQMDSLADFFNFGVAPGLVLYFWKMDEFKIKGVAWTAVLLLAICMAIRLARFNVGISRDQNNPLVKYFFQGMPAPAVAGMVMLPAIISLQFGEGFYSNANFVVGNVMLFSLFAASTIPTPAVTKIPIRQIYKNLVLVILAVFVIGMLTKPWMTLTIMALFYAVAILVGLIVYYKIKNSLKRKTR